MDKFNELINETFEKENLIKIIFSGLRKKSDPCRRIEVRPILLQGQLCYQVEYHYEKKVTHENTGKEQCLKLCSEFLAEQFKQVNLFSADSDYQILASKPDRPKIIKKPATKALQSLDHNQTKNYIIPENEPCDFLIRLGVMDKSGQVIRKHYAKFRQINRFLEIVADVLDYLPAGDVLRIIDFGCGKAYLTFALYHYLKLKQNRNVEIIGLDLKTDVIEFCNRVARDLSYDGLQFLMGDIADYSGKDKADMVVTLHACDTATDFALIKAVNWGASVILSVPCCQHELFKQISNELHHPILKHGILNERFCSILTDGLRGLKLEESGYEVSMIEFTSLEHTSKNIMIRAVKTGKPGKNAAEEYQKLKEYWNVNPTIDQLNIEK